MKANRKNETPFTLKMESHHSNVRIIILKDNVEMACRIEKAKTLTQFLQTTNERLFKGRLQLLSNQNSIFIFVKGDVVYEISKDAFSKMLSNI